MCGEKFGFFLKHRVLIGTNTTWSASLEFNQNNPFLLPHLVLCWVNARSYLLNYFETMLMLLESDVPFYVKGSAYLKSLLSNGPFPERGLEVPVGCAKADLRVDSASDLTELLLTLRFWMVPEVLETCTSFFRFSFDPFNKISLDECASEFEYSIPLVARIAAVVNAAGPRG